MREQYVYSLTTCLLWSLTYACLRATMLMSSLFVCWQLCYLNSEHCSFFEFLKTCSFFMTYLWPVLILWPLFEMLLTFFLSSIFLFYICDRSLILTDATYTAQIIINVCIYYEKQYIIISRKTSIAEHRPPPKKKKQYIQLMNLIVLNYNHISPAFKLKDHLIIFLI